MKKKYIFILVFLLVIGFASVTTTLVLNGKVSIGAKLDDFDVIFLEALLDGEETSKAVISEDKKSITFTTDRFSNLGDSARLDYKVRNTSTQYDADVTINCTNEVDEYVKVSGQFDGNNIPLENVVNMKAQEIKNGYLNAELVQAYVGEDTSVEIKCRIVVTATSRESYAYSLNFDSQGGSRIDDKGVILNESYGELPIPERIGYNFLGWYDEEDNKVDENTKLNKKENKTLHAKWEIKVYPVGIITNSNGSSEVDNINVAYGGTANIKITPDKNYYLSSINCSEGYSVDNYNANVATYSSQTIRIKNNNADIEGTCMFEFSQGIFEYGYTGNAQTFTVPLDGNYKLETWGASGQTAGVLANSYGRGGYTSGSLQLEENLNLYLYVGGANSSGFNGSGVGEAPGGGATDVRLINGSWNNFESLKSRIMVAGGGGGGMYTQHATLVARGDAGGLNGMNANATYTTAGTSEPCRYSNGFSGNGATQILGGKTGIHGYWAYETNMDGSFGQGGYQQSYHSSGGGSGYYGGGHGRHTGRSWSGGGGGSSFISGHTGCNAIAESSTSSNIVHTGQSNHYSGYVFTNTNMIAGNASMPTHDGNSRMTGNTGNGYAKITYLGKEEIEVEECSVNVGQTWDYSYKGNEEIFSIPCSGYYKLETWGAQGGSVSSYVGGYGGYSYGEINLSKENMLYINVGGKGRTISNSSAVGGYNGGGSASTSSSSDIAGSGGGATHIALQSGLLSTLANSPDKILIVAGGGGGAYYHAKYNSTGGAGGGINGATVKNGTCSDRTRVFGTDATQTTGGNGVYCGGGSVRGTFGTGGPASWGWSSGGGAGYYGGGSGYASGAQGGSGYIGNSHLSNKAMYCYNCTASSDQSTLTVSTTNVSASAVSNYTKTGDGYVRITYVGY